MDSERDRKFSIMMAQAQNGNQIIYEALLKEVAVVMSGYLRKRIYDHAFVEDVLQEILISLHKAKHTYKPESPFMPWLFAIAEFRLIDFLRKYTKIRNREVTGLEVEHSYDPAVDAKKEDLSEKMDAALSALTPKQKKVVELLKVQHFSVKEVASQLNMSESAVKVNAHRGYQSLRLKLGVEDDEN